MLAEFTFRWKEMVASPDFGDCATCPHRNACSTRTAYRVPPLRSKLWPSCPVWLHGQPEFQAASRHYEASRVSPLSGWPDEYTAWARDALVALHDEDEAAQLRVIEAARQPPGSGGGRSAALPPHSENRRAPRSARVGA